LFAIDANDTTPCGQPSRCFCGKPIQHFMVCYDIRVFPIFSEKEATGITYIDLHKTRLHGLPPFTKERWPRLKFLDIQYNEFLSCSYIDTVLAREGLTIFSDCNATVESVTTVNNETNTTFSTPPDRKNRGDIVFITLLTVLGTFLSIGGVFSGYRELERRKYSVYTPPPPLPDTKIYNYPSSIHLETEV
jgi:hypothetical protein